MLVERDRHGSTRRGSSPSPERRAGRGLSITNMQLVEDARRRIAEKEEHLHQEDDFELFDASAKTSFILPNINEFDSEIGSYIKKDLIDANSFTNLHEAGRLNWWADTGVCRKLFPLSTIGDGNCLLHAASLGMWGFHDRLLVLRKALYELLRNNKAKGSLKRRWKYQLWKENLACGGLTYSRDEWEDEWDEVVKLASDRRYTIEDGKPKRKISRNSFYGMPHAGLQRSLHSAPQRELLVDEYLQSLEPIHVYALSNLLCRPVIIIADKMLKDSDGKPLAPIPFGGVYLPFECPVDMCYRFPLILSYDSSHFCPLVPAQGECISHLNGARVELSSSVPLVESDLTLMPVKYATDPGVAWDLVQDDSIRDELPELTVEERVELLSKYLDLVVVVSLTGGHNPISQGGGKVLPTEILAARLNVNNLPSHYTEMIAGYVESSRRKILNASSTTEKSARREKKAVFQASQFSSIPESIRSPLSVAIKDMTISPRIPSTKDPSSSPKVKEPASPLLSPKDVPRSPSSPILPFIRDVLRSPLSQRKSKPKAQKTTSSPTLSRRSSSKPCALPTCPNNAASGTSKYCASCAPLYDNTEHIDGGLSRSLPLPDSLPEAHLLVQPSSRKGSGGIPLPMPANNSAMLPVDRGGYADEKLWTHRRTPSAPFANSTRDAMSGFQTRDAVQGNSSGSPTSSSYGLSISLVKKHSEMPVAPESQPRPVRIAIGAAATSLPVSAVSASSEQSAAKLANINLPSSGGNAVPLSAALDKEKSLAIIGGVKRTVSEEIIKSPAIAVGMNAIANGERVASPAILSGMKATAIDERMKSTVTPGGLKATASDDMRIPFVAGALCLSPGCKFYGSSKTNGYCSYCYKLKLPIS